MEKFISCDWGTSTFRLKLVETKGLKIIAEENSNEGIARSFELWKQSERGEELRLSFYVSIIERHIQTLEKKLDLPLNGSPLIISGMACSSIGMINLPYKEIPFYADGSDLNTKIIGAGDNFKHETLIISGAKTNDDAMRGEETQLAGCFANGAKQKKQFFIFPGTHSKHVAIKKEKVVAINTYMTGEFFELLSKKSVLSASVEDGEELLSEKNLKIFRKGVKDSLRANLLHASFLVRTNQLFGKLTKQENYYYLSGLLIGTEMKEVVNADFRNITLVSNGDLGYYYETAFKILNKGKAFLQTQNADDAIVAGQFKILRQIPKND